MNPPPLPPASPHDVREVTPAQALAMQGQGAVMVDVREDNERVSMAAGALGLARGRIPTQLGGLVPALDTPVVFMCATGVRSRLAVITARAMGYASVASLAGGFARWCAQNLPLAPGSLDGAAASRYARQLVLPQVGAAGQQRLMAARVAVIGAGGLGAPALLYLAGAGVGHLTLIDHDQVDRSNLHRQVVHADAHVGMAKVESARQQILALNPSIHVQAHAEKLQAANVESLVAGHDVILDGSDNFPTRYLLSAASLRLGIPVVYGAVERFSGQASVFDPRRDDSPCYRCMYPHPPRAGDAPDCNEAGVLGVLPGMIGLVQATEVLKLVLRIGEPLVGRLLAYDALSMRFRELSLTRDPACPGCGAAAPFTGYRDIEAFCASA